MEWFFSKANAGLLVVSHHNDQRTLEDIHCDNSQKVCCITSTYAVCRGTIRNNRTSYDSAPL